MKKVTTSWTRRIHRQLLLLLGALVLGCAMTGPVSAMSIVGYNYTDDVVEAFSVNGYPGPNVYPHGGGGKFVCCISVPQEWKPGMTVTVKWTAHRNANPIPWNTRAVEVPRYTPDEISRFAVHFFPGDEVKVLVTTKGPGHPDYPYPSPKMRRQ
ncbi:DUF3304 domain-containing protein [Ralstonia wenshanensis]|uniref:DUF3304 domain-containing protein n=2 Tax=Ralstonia wenshanensis TaxID=2842456 RepID=UPI002AACFA63|nr:DUF3304 domain-containing protein [Ralstonia wenshanensis]MDY7507712.1 DUF3304 domain-containing protein [Ralstonia wenshanensis]